MAVLPLTHPGISNGAEDGGLARGHPTPLRDFTGAVLRYLSTGPVELRGVLPVPLEERMSTQYSTYVSAITRASSFFLEVTRSAIANSFFYF